MCIQFGMFKKKERENVWGRMMLNLKIIGISLLLLLFSITSLFAEQNDQEIATNSESERLKDNNKYYSQALKLLTSSSNKNKLERVENLLYKALEITKNDKEKAVIYGKLAYYHMAITRNNLEAKKYSAKALSLNPVDIYAIHIDLSTDLAIAAESKNYKSIIKRLNLHIVEGKYTKALSLYSMLGHTYLLSGNKVKAREMFIQAKNTGEMSDPPEALDNIIRELDQNKSSAK